MHSRSDLNDLVSSTGLPFCVLVSGSIAGLPEPYQSIILGYRGSEVLLGLQPDMGGWLQGHPALASSYPVKRTSVTQVIEVTVHACH